MTNLMVALVILSIIALSIIKIIKDRRRGIKCTGCAHSSGNCSAKQAPFTPSKQINIKQLM
jgi:hypothetical protein